MTNSQFLQWIHDRLVNVHHENDHYDYMWKLRELIEFLKQQELIEFQKQLEAVKHSPSVQ